MSTGAIENLLRNSFGSPTSGGAARTPEPLPADAFTQHLRPADPPPASAPAASPKPPEEKARERDDDTEAPDVQPATNESPAAAAPAPPAANQNPPAPAKDENQTEAVPGDDGVTVGANPKNVPKKAPPRRAEPATDTKAPTVAQPEPSAEKNTEVVADSEPVAKEGTLPQDGKKAAAELIAENTKAAAAPKEAPVVTEPTAKEKLPETTTAEATDEVIVSDTGTNVAETNTAAIAAAQKAAASKPKTEKPAAPAAARETAAESETTKPEATAPPVEAQITNNAAADGEATEEKTPKATSTAKKNAKSAASSASEQTDALDNATATTTDGSNTSNNHDGSAKTAADITASATAAAPADANAKAENGPAPATATPLTAVHDVAAPARRSSLTLAPPSTDRTPGGIRLTEGEQTRFVQRVARAFEAAQQRDGEIRLRLSPPELGSLRLEVKLQGGVMSARIETETESARTVLLDQLPALKERLAEHNIRVEKFDVDVADRRSGGQAQTPDQPERQPRFEPRRPVAVKPPISNSEALERTLPRPSGEKGRINVII